MTSPDLAVDATPTARKTPWQRPALLRLPPLTNLTLQTGGAIPGGGGSGGGGSTVV